MCSVCVCDLYVYMCSVCMCILQCVYYVYVYMYVCVAQCIVCICEYRVGLGCVYEVSIRIVCV